jgi:hypothetical protein
MKMKPLLKLLTIAILLIGINWNACFAETPETGPRMILLPDRYKCLELLELERVKVDPRTHTMTFTDPQLAADYHNVAGWLRGFFTAFNTRPDSDGNVTKGATTYQLMAWIFSYCRAHPSETLENVAVQFVNAMKSTKN